MLTEKRKGTLLLTHIHAWQTFKFVKKKSQEQIPGEEEIEKFISYPQKELQPVLLMVYIDFHL